MPSTHHTNLYYCSLRDTKKSVLRQRLWYNFRLEVVAGEASALDLQLRDQYGNALWSAPSATELGTGTGVSGNSGTGQSSPKSNRKKAICAVQKCNAKQCQKPQL
eukprot:2566406-Rhodomonas_salina.1